MKIKRILCVALMGIYALLGGCENTSRSIMAAEISSPLQSRVTSGTQEVPDEKFLLKKLEDYKKMNKKIVGVLMIPGTMLTEEPVMQAEDNEQYSRRDYRDFFSFEGSIRADFACDMKEMSQNTVLYGNNLGNPQGVQDDPNGLKFAQLFHFTDPEFVKENPKIYLTVEDQIHTYEVFSAAYYENGAEIQCNMPYYTATEFKELIAQAIQSSVYPFGCIVDANDRVLTLITSTYQFGSYKMNPNQQFVVMCRRVER